MEQAQRLPGVCPHPCTHYHGKGQGQVWDRTPHPCARGGYDDACSWILFVLVLATQKCHLPRAVSRAAPDKQEHRQPCLLTNKWLPAAPEGEECSKDGWLGCTQAPVPVTSSSPPAWLHPRAPQCPHVCPVCPGCSLPHTSAWPWGCSGGLLDSLHAPHGLGTLTCHAGRPLRCMLQRGQRS